MVLLLFLIIPGPITSDLNFDVNLVEHGADFTPLDSKHPTGFIWDWVGPEGGELYNIIVDPQNQNLAFTFSNFDLWRTTDGTSWSVIPQFQYRNLGSGTFISINRALVATEDSLYLTTDGGNNWGLINYNFGDYILAMTEEARDTVLVVGETQDGHVIHRTLDGGNSFDSLAEVTGYIDVFSIAYNKDSTIFLGALYPAGVEDTAMIIRSTDLGQNWTVILQENDTLEFGDVADIELNPSNPQEIFVCLGMDGGPSGVLQSSDNGNSWDSYGTDDGLFLPTDVEFLSNDSIIVSSIFRRGIFLGDRSVPGWSFFRVDSNYNSASIEGSVGSIWYCATCGGVMKSTDNGLNWYDNTSGLKALTVWVVYDNFTPPLNGRMYATSFFGNTFYFSSDGGETWSKKGDNNIIWRPAIDAFPGDPTLVYASGLWVDIVGLDTIAYDFLVSTNSGLDWDTVHQAAHPDSAIIFSSLHASLTDSDWLLGRHIHENEDSEAIYLSSNQGQSWAKVFDDVDGPIVGSDTVFVIDETEILYSINGGLSWDTLVSGFQVYSYDYDPDDQFLYVIKDVSSDPDSLLRIHLDGTIEPLYAIAGMFPLIDAHGNDNLFISLTAPPFLPMLMRSEDAGSTFVIDTLSFLPVGIAVSQNEVLLADLGKGFWRSSDATSIQEEQIHYPTFQLRVYPSVFSNHLMFEAEGRLPIWTRIYDVSGRLVDSLILDKRLTVWQKKLPAGVYFYKLDGQRGCGKVIKID